MRVGDDRTEHSLSSVEGLASGDDTLGHPAAWYPDVRVVRKCTALRICTLTSTVHQDTNAKLGVSTVCVEQPYSPVAGHLRMSKHRGE